MCIICFQQATTDENDFFVSGPYLFYLKEALSLICPVCLDYYLV